MDPKLAYAIHNVRVSLGGEGREMTAKMPLPKWQREIMWEVNYCFSWDRDLAYQHLRNKFKGRNQEIALELWDNAAEYPAHTFRELLEDILA